MTARTLLKRLVWRLRSAIGISTAGRWSWAGVVPDGFDETAYLKANPDVAAAVLAGSVTSGREHYARRGREERRPLFSGQVRGTINVDAGYVEPDGAVLLTGWIDDEDLPFRRIELIEGATSVSIAAGDLLRCPREDIAAILQRPSSRHLFGFVLVGRLQSASPASRESVAVRIEFATGEQTRRVLLRPVSESHLFEVALDALVAAHRSDIDVFPALIPGPPRVFREQLTALWKRHIEGATVDLDVTFGEVRNPRLSVATVIYGSAQPLSVQAALLYKSIPRQDIEIIVVNNSPAIANELVREIELAHLTHGLCYRLVSLSRNTGFSHANNVAVSLARAPRIAFVNPDVYSADGAWFEALTGPEQLPFSICGAVLYYADGAVMHDGMEITREYAGCTTAGAVSAGVLRVDHYSKGAPAWAIAGASLRRVPAVTGAFLATSVETFRTLGGFSEDYIFGHFEDADLCLRAWEKGLTVGVSRQVRLTHLEGKGAAKNPRLNAVIFFNRARFSERWATTLAAIDEAVRGSDRG